MSVTPNRHVLLFAGQGSHQYLANPAHVRAMTEQLLDEHLEAFWDFLCQCREAFHIELESTSDEERSTLEGSLKDAFQDAESFLSPPEAFRSHPVVETLSLYTHQVLELMLFQSHNECKTVIEASGICTGILPAILAASFVSYSSPNFIASAVELFRLAFWIGLRASLLSRPPPNIEWQKAPCLLSVFGISVEELENYMNEWKDSKHVCSDPTYKLPIMCQLTFCYRAQMALTEKCGSLASSVTRIYRFAVQTADSGISSPSLPLKILTAGGQMSTPFTMEVAKCNIHYRIHLTT